MLRRVLTTGLLVLLAAAATAAEIPDTKENRVLQAQRVVTGTPIEETLEGIVQEAIKIKGPEVAGEIRAAIARSDTSELTQAMERAYATTFTAEELAFLADYAHSEVGKRVQAKMSVYVGKVHPVMKAYAHEIFEDVKNQATLEQLEQGGAGQGGKKKKAKAAAPKQADKTPAEGIKVASPSAAEL